MSSAILPKLKHLRLPCAIAATALVLSGCGAERLPTEAASGTIYLDDKPLPEALVTFLPERGQAASDTTDASGKFVLTTFKEGDGAIAGRHLVVVSKYENFVPKQPASSAPSPLGLPAPPGKSLIPEHYGNTATSGLAYDVVAGQDNVFDIRLSSQRK